MSRKQKKHTTRNVILSSSDFYFFLEILAIFMISALILWLTIPQSYPIETLSVENITTEVKIVHTIQNGEKRDFIEFIHKNKTYYGLITRQKDTINVNRY